MPVAPKLMMQTLKKRSDVTWNATTLAKVPDEVESIVDHLALGVERRRFRESIVVISENLMVEKVVDSLEDSLVDDNLAVDRKDDSKDTVVIRNIALRMEGNLIDARALGDPVGGLHVAVIKSESHDGILLSHERDHNEHIHSRVVMTPTRLVGN